MEPRGDRGDRSGAEPHEELDDRDVVEPHEDREDRDLASWPLEACPPSPIFLARSRKWT